MERSGMHSATPLKKNEKNGTELAKIMTARLSPQNVSGWVVAGSRTISLRLRLGNELRPFRLPALKPKAAI
jgi:hypothetical protein